jgi:hypothetical protein
MWNVPPNMKETILKLLKVVLSSRLSLLFILLTILTVAFAGPQPAAMASTSCSGGDSGTITSYSDATYTTVVGNCRKLCCWTGWVCSGQVTIYRIEDINTCEPL